jgi:hypothetical protein
MDGKPTIHRLKQVNCRDRPYQGGPCKHWVKNRRHPAMDGEF